MDYIHIGKIATTFGIKGEVLLVHGLEKKSNFNGVEVLFVEETKNSYLPYFIQNLILLSMFGFVSFSHDEQIPQTFGY